jgi:pyridinium-3,5-biscarboxylic acid mononucleotide sulfurtransferase
MNYHEVGQLETNDKYQKLMLLLMNLRSAAVAFSGGVDSTFLLAAAHQALGGRAVAVTARSLSFPKRELAAACEFAAKNGIRQIIVDSEELDIEGFSQNPVNRCYLCKSELFTKIKAIAKEQGLQSVIEGANADDTGDYRPGMKAIHELGVISPLKEVGLAKDEIRALSQKMGLPTWDKPAMACLASRFPYGEEITPEKLRMVDEAEQYLLDMGIRQVRVRCHGNLARIEADEDGFAVLVERQRRGKVYQRLKEIGFTYVALDVQGYRTGSMNETLNLKG